MRLQPRTDLEHVVDAFRDRACEDDILRYGWRKGIACRHQETVRLLAREPERQRELDRGAFRHGAERMRYDGAVGAPVNARSAIDRRCAAASFPDMADEQIGERSGAGEPAFDALP